MVLKFKERKIIERIKAETDNKHGCIPEERSVEELLDLGVVNLNKPQGPTSHQIADSVKNVLGVKKCGHSGTLDPNVTGVLVVALGRGTRAVDVLLKSGKEYVGIMRIHEERDMKEVQKIINKKFLGKIQQLPPVKSRVKRQVREREVMKFKLLEQDGKNILFETLVQAGTYIRKLISDLGDEIGGAHMLELRRTRAGIFDEKDSISLYELDKLIEDEKKLRKIINPGEIIKQIHPVVQIKKHNLKQIFTGKPIHDKDLEKKELTKKGETICVFNKDRFIGMYEIKNQKDAYAKSKFVMQPLKD